jgi:hypothetical protein
MRIVLCSSVLLGLLAAHLNAGSIAVQALPTGPKSAHYTLTLNGFSFLKHWVLDVQFDPSVYFSLSNALDPANFSTQILEPGNPPGAPGDYLLEALIANPVLKPGSVGIDVTFTGLGEPKPLPFFIYKFDRYNKFKSLVASGLTYDPPPLPVAPTPEPSGVWLTGLGLLVAGILGSRRRHRDIVRNESAGLHELTCVRAFNRR